MKNPLILLILLMSIVYSCSNRLELIQSLDIKPSLRIRVKDSLYHRYQDSIKLEKNLLGFSSIDLVDQSSEGLSNFFLRKVNGDGFFLFRSDTIKENILNPSSHEMILKFLPKELGISEYHFIVKDKFQVEDSVIYRIYSFKNLKPIADFQVKPLKIIDSLEYEITGEKSYDPDLNYGGSLIAYIFYVNGQVIKSYTPSIKFIFPLKGFYPIQFQVMDNDSSLSDLVSKSILIN